jgi:uncharacterized protein YjiS (DUF1127 family)
MQPTQIQSLTLPRDFRPTAQFGSIRAAMAEWWRRLRQRRELLMLTDRDLSDIGITRSDAVAEASKFFWQW